MARMEIDEFASIPATTIVPLGGRCAATHNIRRYFNFRSGFPFDWWISPMNGVAWLLQQDSIEGMYQPNALFRRGSGHDTVSHVTSGILLHHEFPRRWDLKDQPIAPDFIRFLEEPKRRSIYLWKKLLDCDRVGERILFVREILPEDNLEDWEIVLDALSSKFINSTWAAVAIPPVESGIEDWKGDAEAWDRSLMQLGVSLERGRHKPFEHVEPADFHATTVE